MRTYDEEFFKKNGIHKKWVQENHSRSERKHIIRGFHFQFSPFAEAKLVRAIKGSVLDVFLDLRKYSSTFGEWDSLELTENNNKLVFIPQGVAHAFCTLTDISEVLYKVDNCYAPEAEGGIVWNDESLKIKWPTSKPILSEKDTSLMTLETFIKEYQGLEA